MCENRTQDIINAKNGNEDAMEKLVNDNQGLIWSIVRRFKDRGYEIEDLYQIGCLGFIKSIKRFDETFEVRLSTYAVPYILGEIKRFIRDDGPVKVSRSIKELGAKVRDVQKEFMYKNGYEIKIEEIAKILKVSKEEIAMALDCFNTVESIYQTSDNGEDEGQSIIDKLSNNQDEAGTIIDNLTLKTAIDRLDDRSKKIILLRYYKGRTQTQVAKILGITQVQVSRIEKRILSEMKQLIAG